MKLKISDEEIERILGETATAEEIIERRIKYRPFRDLIEFSVACIMKNGYITSGDVKNKFRVSTRWSLEKLHDLVNLGLLTSKNITGSNMTEFRAVLDDKGEPKINKCYEKYKNWSRIW